MIDVSFSSALDEANDIIEAGAHFKAVTERGRAVKARFAFFCNETMLKEGNVDGDSVLYRIFHSLLADMVPAEQQRIV